MTLRLVRLHDVAPAPWRNGGGSTRALLAWPRAEDWAVRISVAEIAQDGPFSAYPGVQRWFAVVEGAGVQLAFDGDRLQRCTAATPPFAFDGDDAPACRLIDGPTQDLNLMVRAATGSGTMRRATEPLAPCAFRAVYCADAATLHRGDALPESLPAGSLAWCADPGDTAVWHLDSHGSRCWWLTFDPASAASGSTRSSMSAPR